MTAARNEDEPADAPDGVGELSADEGAAEDLEAPLDTDGGAEEAEVEGVGAEVADIGGEEEDIDDVTTFEFEPSVDTGHRAAPSGPF